MPIVVVDARFEMTCSSRFLEAPCTGFVACTVNGSPKKMFLGYERSNGTVTYPAPYQLQY